MGIIRACGLILNLTYAIHQIDNANETNAVLIPTRGIATNIDGNTVHQDFKVIGINTGLVLHVPTTTKTKHFTVVKVVDTNLHNALFVIRFERANSVASYDQLVGFHGGTRHDVKQTHVGCSRAKRKRRGPRGYHTRKVLHRHGIVGQGIQPGVPVCEYVYSVE